MADEWVRENLLVIRTLMERAAIYRRALAPATLWTGGVGLGAGAVAMQWGMESGMVFVGYWLGVGVLVLGGVFLLVRGQALRAREPVWSPPARRVIQAMGPSLVVGLVPAFWALAMDPGPERVTWLPALWMVLYGIALCAAGFFMQRGIKLFGWVFIGAGAWVFVATQCGWMDWGEPGCRGLNLEMGAAFGGLHLAYGVYLHFSEKRNPGV